MDTFRKGPGDKRGGNYGEFHLEKCKQGKGYCGSGYSDLRQICFYISNIAYTYIFHHEEVGRVSNDMPDIVTESETEAEHDPDYTYKAHDNEAL